MKRREFVGCATAASMVTLASGTESTPAKNKNSEKDPVVKITVIKRAYYKDLYQKYRGIEGEICSVFKDNQEFVLTSPWRPPEGFCPWAWADIRTSIQAVYWGGRKNSVACCTDGFRPVVFNIERV